VLESHFLLNKKKRVQESREESRSEASKRYFALKLIGQRRFNCPREFLIPSATHRDANAKIFAIAQ
jgi:hypothetical protein